MAPHVFVVVPYGAKWGVSSGGEVMAVAKSKRAAQDLARKAGEALQPAGSAPANPVPLHERRSFLES